MTKKRESKKEKAVKSALYRALRDAKRFEKGEIKLKSAKDIGLSILMAEADRSKKVPRSTIMENLKRGILTVDPSKPKKQLLTDSEYYQEQEKANKILASTTHKVIYLELEYYKVIGSREAMVNEDMPENGLPKYVVLDSTGEIWMEVINGILPRAEELQYDISEDAPSL